MGRVAGPWLRRLDWNRGWHVAGLVIISQILRRPTMLDRVWSTRVPAMNTTMGTCMYTAVHTAIADGARSFRHLLEGRPKPISPAVGTVLIFIEIFGLGISSPHPDIAAYANAAALLGDNAAEVGTLG